VQAGRHQHGGIGLARDVVVGRVRQHVVVVLPLLRVAPLVELVGGERDALVEHRRDDVDERHLRDDRAVIGARLVGDRAHQQPAGAAAHCRHALRVGIAFLHQEARDVDEVVEGVALPEELAVLVPAPAHLLAAAHVRERVDEAAVEQRQPRDRERRVHGRPVRAVGVLQHRRAAVLPEPDAVDERHRHLRAVARLGPHELGPVVRGIEVAEHRGALPELPLAGLDVVVVDRRRRRERGVLVAHDLGVELRVLVEARRVGRLVRRDEEVLAAVQRPDADLAHRAGALLDREEAPEHVEAMYEGVVPVRQDLAPLRPVALLADGRLHQPEVRRVPVGADEPAPVEVLDVVLVVALARQEHAERERRVVGARVAVLGRDRALRDDEDVALVLGGRDGRVETFVLLLVDQRVGGRIGAEHVAAHAIAEQRLRVLLEVQDAAAVRGPGKVRLHVRDRAGQYLAGLEVLEAQRVLPAPDRVLGKGQQPVVGRHRRPADLEEAVALGHRVDVEHDLLRRVERAGLARVHRVLPAGHVTRVVPVAAQAIRDRRVVLLDAPHDFAVDPVLERLRVRRHRRLVGVLRLEVTDDRRVRARVVAQPVILVVAVAVRRGNDVRPCGGHRRYRR